MTDKRQTLQELFDAAKSLANEDGHFDLTQAVADAWDAYYDVVNALTDDEYEDFFGGLAAYNRPVTQQKG